MADLSSRRAAAFFIADTSPLAAEVQHALTKEPYRCNIMMVSSGDQALAILRQETRAAEPAAPHVVLIYGGLNDGRAGKLVDALRDDATYSSIPIMIVIGPADEAEAASGSLKLDPFAMTHLSPLLANRALWWVMAKLG